ncbi:MAG: LysM peptidoglycan-binding domain-containing protein [Verrucomicrobia bacterium]|nr:LysM peptidoglycan-binding domain-containing protein [Verrucomicrobiota bacterium]
MKPLSPLVLLSIACLVTSCNERQPRSAEAGPTTARTPTAGYCLPASTAWAEDDFTQWMTRAELQHFQAQTPPDQYFAHVEGRNNGGLSEYRAVRKPLPSDQYVKSAVCWGLGDKELFDTELRLLRTGFVRKSMQVFVDASGTALHQLVWLKPLGASDSLAEPAAIELPQPLADTRSPEPATSPNLPGTAPSDATAGVGQGAATADPDPDATAPEDSAPVADKPPVAVVVPPSAPPGSRDEDPKNAKKFTTYTVVQGDILEKIARRQHTSVEAIKAANNLDNDKLRIGQKLRIPKK